MRKLTADYIYPISSAPIKEGVVIVDDNGKIEAITSRDGHELSSLEAYQGVITPGFINTHCHLELSHMKGKVDTGTGLISFITGVVTKRAASEEEIQNAIAVAEAEMIENGIVAVGDISNVPDTFLQKSKGNIRYHTFVEFFDFLQNQNAVAEFEKYKAVYDELNTTDNKNKKTCVPHAPYSVSEKLFALINETHQSEDITVSIHNQETPPENELFLNGSGGFYDFYGAFGISLEDFKPNHKTAIHYALSQMNPKHRSLFVHNTLTTESDIKAAHDWSENVFWATCPNANLYIENRLPNYQAFLNQQARMTIGTDSLTSNWQLSVLEEMKTIAKYQSYVPFETLIQWATLNGAQALGFDEALGSIEVGKTPGLNLIKMKEIGVLDKDSSVKKLC